MTWPVLASLAGVAVSLIGVAYAIHHGTETRRIAEQALGFQAAADAREKRKERKRIEEQGRAKLVSEIGTVGTWFGRKEQLLVRNRGHAEAKSIRIRIEGWQPHNCPYIVGEPPSAVSSLSPEDPPLVFDLTGRSHESPQHLDVMIKWDDESGGGEWERQLDW